MVNDRGENGVGVKRARSVEKAPYGQEHWRMSDRKWTAAQLDGTPEDAGAVVLAGPVCEWVRGPALGWGNGNLESAGAGQSVA